MFVSVIGTNEVQADSSLTQILYSLSCSVAVRGFDLSVYWQPVLGPRWLMMNEALGPVGKRHSMIVEYSSILVCACACTCVYKELISKESIADCNLSCFAVFS